MKEHPKASTKKPVIAVIMGSKSDWGVMQHSVEQLLAFGLVPEVRIMSAHRTPEEASAFASTAASRGLKILISAAGMAAHLGGFLAAHTHLPVIGVPLKGGAMDGIDSLLSTVQMPGGVPVATVALGKAGAINAALLAVQMLALSDPALKRKFIQHKRKMQKAVFDADMSLVREVERMI